MFLSSTYFCIFHDLRVNRCFRTVISGESRAAFGLLFAFALKSSPR